MEQIANHFEPKGAERTGYPVLSAPDVSSHAGGHWFESSSLHQILGNQVFPRIFLFFRKGVTSCFFVGILMNQENT